MFELFANNRIRRIGFLSIFVAMIAFDFAKSPIEKFIQHQASVSASIAFGTSTPDHPVDTAPAPAFKSVAQQYEINQKTGSEPDMSNIMAVASAYQKMQNDAKKNGRKVSEAELRAGMLATLAAKNNTPAQLQGGANLYFFKFLFIAVALAMNGITYVTAVWMTTGRIRDIGWSQLIAVGILACYFAPFIFGRHMPELLLKACNPTFIMLTIFIGLIPSKGDGQDVGSAPVAIPTPRSNSTTRAQFGRLGS